MNKKRQISKIVKHIKQIKIQGARNIARAALYAYSLSPSKETRKKLEGARPTEPLLSSTLDKFSRLGYARTLAHFDQAQQAIDKQVLKLIKNNYTIFTHCHSTNVTRALVYAKKSGKKFQVYNTETRPLYQGRKTARELEKAGIQVTMFIDSALDIAFKDTDIIFLGADALLKKPIQPDQLLSVIDSKMKNKNIES